MALSGARDPDSSCLFCAPDRLAPLYEGEEFFILADHAPLAEGHLLLIPRVHYPYLAALPEALDEGFAELKAWIGTFVEGTFGALTYWENGVFGQSVPHAHLHVLSLHWDPSLYHEAGPLFSDLAGLRAAYGERPGPYFTLEQAGEGWFLPPDRELYRSVLRYARETFGGQWLVTREERRLQGEPLVASLRAQWEAYVSGGLSSPQAGEAIGPVPRASRAQAESELQAP